MDKGIEYEKEYNSIAVYTAFNLLENKYTQNKEFWMEL